MTNILERQGHSPNQDAIRVKYMHLNSENANLAQRIRQLQIQNQSLREFNQQLQHASPHSSDTLVLHLTGQNQQLQQALHRLSGLNEQLSCDVLMKSQLICQNDNEFKEILISYEEKILELRGKCQTNERMIGQLQEQVSSEKQHSYVYANRLNLICFNEVNELKQLVSRFNLQNAELKALIAKREVQLRNVKAELLQCERALKDRENWQTYKRSLCDSTKKKNTTSNDVLLDEEPTRHEEGNKLPTVKPVNPLVEINKLKAIVTKFAYENSALKSEVTKLQRSMQTQGKQHKLLQQACLKLETAMGNNKVEIQFYRNNFKELTKVTSERKIHYYQQSYEAQLPQLQKQLHEKENLIKYWQNWSKVHGNFEQKIALRTTGNKRRRVRNKSCPFILRQANEANEVRACSKKDEELSIMSFIEEFNADADPQLEEVVHLSDLKSFQDEFSVIAKPKTMGKAQAKKMQFVEMDIDLDD